MKVRQVSVTQVQIEGNKGETHVTGNVGVNYQLQTEVLLDGLVVLFLPLAQQLGKNPQEMEQFLFQIISDKLSKSKGSRVY